LAVSDILGRLNRLNCKTASTEGSISLLTERRTPIPEETNVAGENACEMGISVAEVEVDLMELTNAVLSTPSVVEKAYRTSMVGFNHRDNFSSERLDCSNSFTLF
jgi:hypothetical protein